MRRIVRIFTLTSVVFTTGCWRPYGGAKLIAAEVDLLPVSGFTLSRPDLVDKEKGVLVHGQICTNGWPPFTNMPLSVQRLTAEGSLIEQAEAYAYGMPDAYASGCGYYSADTGWRLGPRDIVRIGPTRAE